MQLDHAILPGDPAGDPRPRVAGRVGAGGYAPDCEILGRSLDTSEYFTGRRVRQGCRVTFEPLTPERRRALTRQHLLEAAAIVFARDGFHGATLDDVASLAGFTKGAVYSNFKSKDDLFLALCDERVELQFAITAEVLESGSHDRVEQFPRMRELLRATLFGDDAFAALYLEFVLYARRNPAARAKLIESARRERALIESLIEREQGNIPAEPPHPTRALAEFSRAVFNGLMITRLVDPDAVTEETIGTTLEMLYESMGADGDGDQTP
jgi:AcrR family transcriptional regulator